MSSPRPEPSAADSLAPLGRGALGAESCAAKNQTGESPTPLDSTGWARRLVVISGPSGAGKSTVVRKLLQTCQVPLYLSVSATTRPPREGEIDGQDYYFLTDEEFRRRKEAGEFLECKEVFGAGYWYGTLRSEVQKGITEGKFVILEIDVQGAMAILEQFPEAITIFIHPGSMEELERRLRQRGTESEESLTRRLQTAQHEMSYLPRYRYEVVNHSVSQATATICQLLKQIIGAS